MKLRTKKLKSYAKLPTYAVSGDAGMDMYSSESYIIKPGENIPVSTGIATEIPFGFVGLIWDKGGIAKKSLKTVGGVVDAGYRGDIAVQVVNLGKEDYAINRGDKVAQMLIQKVELCEIIETEQLSESERGDGRFGSTGIK